MTASRTNSVNASESGKVGRWNRFTTRHDQQPSGLAQISDTPEVAWFHLP